MGLKMIFLKIMLLSLLISLPLACQQSDADEAGDLQPEIIPGNGFVKVNWDRRSGYVYTLRRTTDPNCNPLTIVCSPVNELVNEQFIGTYIDASVQNFTTYYYWIAEMKESGKALVISGPNSATPQP